MRKGLAYIRVSTVEQAISHLSLSAQSRKLKALAEVHDIELVGIIEDGGFTARNMHRPGIQEAIERIQNGEIDCFLIYKVDRLSRKVGDIYDFVNMLREHDVEFMSAAESIDTSSAHGRFFLTMLAALAELESDGNSERTIAALDERRAQGKSVGTPTYGYSQDEEGYLSA